LLSKTSFKADKKSTIISITVEDEDPQRAADMANAFVEELKELNKGLAITEAAQRRLFFEEQLKATKEALSKAEEDMKAFQEKTGAVKMEAQAISVIAAISQLRAQIAAKEVQIRVMSTYATPRNPDMQKANAELAGLKAQLAGVEAKSNGGNSVSSTGSLTEAGPEYLRKLRNLKFNETLYELLFKQYEAARLDEARDATVIQVVEKAVPPEWKSKPKRAIMVIVATFLGFLVAIGVVIFRERREQMRREDPETVEKIRTLKRLLSFNLRMKERLSKLRKR
jgi:uncharacterized protein involved in exopolysaccharide biosynthesis